MLEVYNYNEIVQCLQDTVKQHYKRAIYNMEQLQKAPKPAESTTEEQPEDEIPPPPEAAIKTLEILSKEEQQQKKRQPKRLMPI